MNKTSVILDEVIVHQKNKEFFVTILNMNSYGITSFIEDLPDGFEFERESWPTHITQIDTFESEYSQDEIIDKLSSAVKNIRQINAKLNAKKLFGPNNDNPVLTLGATPDIKILHTKIVEVLKDLGAQFKRPFILEGNFQPHITIKDGMKVRLNDEITISSVSLIDKSDTKKRIVVKTIALGQQTYL